MSSKLQGTYEIDEDGILSYFFSAFSTDEENQQMIGQTFYGYLKGATVNNELEGKIKNFVAGSASTDSFHFEQVTNGFKQKLLVLLARVRKKDEERNRDLIVIDIKPETKSMDFS